MVFKVNIAQKGKTHKLETESEALVGKKIGETFKGEDIDANLKGFELEITGHSDLSGIPGFKGLEGDTYHRRLLTRGPGMHDTRKGIRLRKTNRGEVISAKTRQVNTIVKKEGEKKFEDLAAGASEATEETSTATEEPKVDEKANTKEQAEKPAEAPAEAPKKEKPAEEKKEEKKEKPAEEKKEEKKEKAAEEKKEETKEEKPAEAPKEEKQEEAPKEEKPAEEKKEETKEEKPAEEKPAE